MYEDKLKRLEEDKLAMLSGKNTEMHRLSEEGKTFAEAIKKKESDLRRVGNELEVARKTIANLDLKSREYD